MRGKRRRKKRRKRRRRKRGGGEEDEREKSITYYLSTGQSHIIPNQPNVFTSISATSNKIALENPIGTQ